MVLRDGVLVGFVPRIPDSDDLDAAAITAIIAGTDYDAPPPPSRPANPTSGPVQAPPPPPSKPVKGKRSLFRRSR
jgi:hypothetical protein